jgi:RNA polymerase sigma factor (sigma-70 family)
MPRIASGGKPNPRWHKVFLAMLPKIVDHAKVAFRHLRGEARQDAIQETIANALVAFVALVRRGKMSIAFPTVLAKYAVAQINDGRRVGNRLNVREVLSPYAQKHKGFKVERLDHFDEDEQAWSEAIVEDRTAGPAETARVRLDFSAWLDSLKRRDRRIAEALAVGNRTSEVAKKFKVSEGRVSQLRRELKAAWETFTGEAESPEAAAVPA